MCWWLNHKLYVENKWFTVIQINKGTRNRRNLGFTCQDEELLYTDVWGWGARVGMGGATGPG